MHILDLDGHIDLGPFSVDLIGLTHSIAEPFALAIRTPLGNLLHTGDWKIDSNPLIGRVTDSDRLMAFGKEGIDAIICDSTNVLSPGVSGSESDVADGLADTIADCAGRVVVTTFASNVARLEAVGRAASKTGRHLALVGRGMHRIYNAARKTGYLQNFPKLISEEDAGYLPPDKLLVLCTGSQGEPRAALARIASGTHPHLVLEEGDTVIFSSKMIPGNETGILDLQNRLAGLGVTILTSGDRILHVSGHPNREELVQMYDWVKPKCAVPVHGEHRHLLAHAALAEELGVPTAIRAKNGDMVKLLPGQAEILDVVSHGRLHMDGDVYVPANESPAIQRRKLAYNGVVTVSIAVDKGGRLAASPEVQTMGLPDDDGLGVKLEDWILDAVDRAVPENGESHRSAPRRRSSALFAEEMRRWWGKNPKFLLTFAMFKSGTGVLSGKKTFCDHTKMERYDGGDRFYFRSGSVYGMIWFVSLFMVLPFGVTTQDEQGEIEPGSPGSAPHQASILKKMGYTTILATVLFLAVYWRPDHRSAELDTIGLLINIITICSYGE